MNQDDDGAGRTMVIRGGLVLDATGFLGATDIVVRDGTIVALGPPGMRVARRRRDHRCVASSAASRAGECAHPWPRQSVAIDGRPMDAGAVAGGGAAYVAVCQRRGEAHFGDHRCGRDAAEGLHRLLRPVRRISAADRGRHRGGCRCLCASRHARRHRTDDGRHDVVRGDPWPDGRAAAASAERGGAARAAAMAGDDRADAVHPAPMARRPNDGAARCGADHPAALPRRVHGCLPRPGGGVRCRHPHPSGGIRRYRRWSARGAMAAR